MVGETQKQLGHDAERLPLQLQTLSTECELKSAPRDVLYHHSCCEPSAQIPKTMGDIPHSNHQGEFKGKILIKVLRRH